MSSPRMTQARRRKKKIRRLTVRLTADDQACIKRWAKDDDISKGQLAR